MKKGFLVLITVIAMMIGLGGAALGAVDVYVDHSGETQFNFKSTTDDASEDQWPSAVLGVNVPIGRFRVASEWYSGSMDHYDVLSCDLKGGYAIINNNFLRLDATLDYHQFSSDEPGYFIWGSDSSMDCDGLLYGLDLRLYFSERFFVEGSIGYTTSGDWDSKEPDGSWGTLYTNTDATVLVYKVKCNLMFFRHWGVSAGYRRYSYRPDSAANGEYNYSGFYYGMIWRFGNTSLDRDKNAPVQPAERGTR